MSHKQDQQQQWQQKPKTFWSVDSLTRELPLICVVLSLSVCVRVYVCVAFAKLRLLRYKTNLLQKQRMQVGKQGVLFSFLSYSSFSWRTYFLPSHAVGSIDLIVIVYLVRMQSMQATHTQILTYTNTHTLTLARQMC